MLTVNLLSPSQQHCSKCKQRKSVAEFSNKSWCRSCMRAYHREDYRQHRADILQRNSAYAFRQRTLYPEQTRSERNREYRALKREQPEKYLLDNARARAAKKNIPFTLTVSDITIPERCPVLGIALSAIGSGSDLAPSLDRFDPAGGYVPGNVVVISHRANTIKSFGTAQEHELIAAWMRAREHAKS